MTTVKNIFRYLAKLLPQGCALQQKQVYLYKHTTTLILVDVVWIVKVLPKGVNSRDEKLVSWQSEKQTCVSISIMEVEYIVALHKSFGYKYN